MQETNRTNGKKQTIDEGVSPIRNYLIFQQSPCSGGSSRSSQEEKLEASSDDGNDHYWEYGSGVFATPRYQWRPQGAGNPAPKNLFIQEPKEDLVKIVADPKNMRKRKCPYYKPCVKQEQAEDPEPLADMCEAPGSGERKEASERFRFRKYGKLHRILYKSPRGKLIFSLAFQRIMSSSLVTNFLSEKSKKFLWSTDLLTDHQLTLGEWYLYPLKYPNFEAGCTWYMFLSAHQFLGKSILQIWGGVTWIIYRRKFK